jgi:hypothetical protein
MEGRASRDERKVKKLNIYRYKQSIMKLLKIFKESLLEAKNKKIGAIDELAPTDWAYEQIDTIYKKNDDKINDEIRKSLMLSKSADYNKFKKALGEKGKDEDLKELIEKLKKLLPNEKIGLEENNDHEVSMAQNSLKSIMKSCADLMNKLGNNERNIPGWIQNHISNAENFIDQAAQGFHELDGHEEEESGIYPVTKKSAE